LACPFIATMATTRARDYHMQIPPSPLPEEGTALPPRAEAVGLAGPIAVSGRRLDPKYAPLLVPAIMAVAMSFVMSLVLTTARLGLASNLLSAWLTAFGIGVILAIPTANLVPRPAQRRVGHLTGVSSRSYPENRR